jgi:hypothetical protein
VGVAGSANRWGGERAAPPHGHEHVHPSPQDTSDCAQPRHLTPIIFMLIAKGIGGVNTLIEPGGGVYVTWEGGGWRGEHPRPMGMRAFTLIPRTPATAPSLATLLPSFSC